MIIYPSIPSPLLSIKPSLYFPYVAPYVVGRGQVFDLPGVGKSPVCRWLAGESDPRADAMDSLRAVAAGEGARAAKRERLTMKSGKTGEKEREKDKTGQIF